MRRAQLYINNTELDLTEDISLPFTYQIADIRNPEQRTQSHSKTITIPASKVNNKLFSHIYEISYASQSTVINFDPDFNPNKKATARVLIDGVEIFNGFAQLMKINKNGSKPESYEIVIFSEVINLFTEIGTDKLSDLDFSEFDHVLDETIISSQTGTNYIDSVLTNYYNGQWDGSHYIATGLGYTYPNIDYGENPSTYWKVSKMYPAVPIKQYLDKIFAKYGYSYTSTLFTSQFFKQLIIPCNLPKIQTISDVKNGNELLFDDSQSSRTVFDTNTGGAIETLLDGGLETFKLRDVIRDADNMFIPSGGYFKSKYNTYTYLFADVSTAVINYVADEYQGEAVTGANTATLKIGLYIKRASTGTIEVVDEGVASNYNPYNGSTSISSSPNTQATYTFQFNGITDAVNPTYLFFGDIVFIGITLDVATELTLDATGETISNYVGLKFEGLTQELEGSMSSLAANYVDYVNVGYGQGLIMNNFIPDVPIKDLLSDLIKAFNLQIDVDKNNTKNLIIEPYGDYYTGSTIKDWTRKVDTSKPIEVVPMGELDARKYIHAHTFDNDSLNKDYQERFKESYGQNIYDVENEFIKNDKEVRTTFSPSPCYNRNQAGYFAVSVLADGYQSRIKTNYRILYYDLVPQYSGNVIYTDDSGGYLQEAVRYAQALEVDSITAPTFALRFSVVPKVLYYSTSVMTNANFFTRYWKKYIQEITDKDSKIVTLYARLSALDIHKFNFSDTIFIDGNYFIVNKIEEYNPLLAETVKLELLKLKIYAPSIEGTQTIPTTVTSYNLVEGGEDEVRALDATSYYNLIEGGQDEVRDIGATSTIGIINGGQNIV